MLVGKADPVQKIAQGSKSRDYLAKLFGVNERYTERPTRNRRFVYLGHAREMAKQTHEMNFFQTIGRSDI